MDKVYLDHAATTPVFPEVAEAMYDILLHHHGNPSSPHFCGRDAKGYLDEARGQVAALIGAAPEEIFFTSGGTEADNIAVFGSAAAAGDKKHVITSAVEHHAVLDSCQELARLGYDLTVLPVDAYGLVHVEDLQASLRPDTFLVSIMHANNEVGSVNPIKELAAAAHQAGALFHVDAVQSVGKIPVNVTDLDVDMLTYSSHKINGPKGVGALYKRQDVPICRRVFGGGQERQLRSGTENMPGIVGFGKAAALTAQRWQAEMAECRRLRDLLVELTLTRIPHSRLNGHPTQRLPHNANLSFDYIEGEALLLYLDLAGVACSAGSACSSGSSTPSHVLTAMGLEDRWLHSALRFSLGYGVTEEQIRYTAQLLQEKVEQLRMASPFYQGK
ncbi:MAG: cysteine desulfurase [Firmicutes bacterium]|nr:cysteine desulfurase [Bacillota bacterium]